MNKTTFIKKTESFAKKALKKEGTGHDWWHIVRVRNNAKAICKKEKTDRFVINLSLLLHDIGDRKVIHKDKDDYSIAENFLRKNKLSPELIEKVMFIIKNMSFSKTLNTKRKDVSKEFHIVQDADRMDAIGAIGIARAFAFGGSKGRPLYDPAMETREIFSSAVYKQNAGSSVHHFYEKLLLLKNLMNTKTAKKIAGERHKFMEQYLKHFYKEWEGQK